MWAYGRASGVTDLLLLSVSAVLGILARSGRGALWMNRTTLARVHRSISLLAVLFLAIHVVTLSLDAYARLAPVNWFVPFTAPTLVLANALGAVATDLLLAVALSGILRRAIPDRAFRAVHLAAYAALPIALVHGLLAGSDAHGGWFLVVNAVCVAMVLGAVGWRVSPLFVPAVRREVHP